MESRKLQIDTRHIDEAEEQQVLQDEALFAKDIHDWFSGKKKSDSSSLYVAQTPLVLQLAGMDNLPIYIDVSKLGRITKDHPEMTENVFRQIPRALTDPIMVIRSITEPDRLIAVLDVADENGLNIIIPFALNLNRNEGRVNIMTSVYGKGNNGNINYAWYVQHLVTGNLIYAQTEKATKFLAPAGVQFPMAARKGNLLSYSIKTEEDLVKFKREKEEDFLMSTENQARKETVSDYADSYREELADVCAASEESFTPAQNGKLKESADRLYKEMREFEQSEGSCGPDQDAWDAFAALHERNVRSILAAKDISEATGRESKASEEAAGEAVRSIEESIVFISRSRVDLLHKQKVYEDQIEELRRRIEDISEAKTLGVGKEEDFTRTLAAAAGFLKQIEGLRREAGNLPRKPASEMFKASRSSVRRAYFAVQLTPPHLRRHIKENAPQEVSRVLQQAAVAFEQGSESLGQAKEAIVRTARSHQSAADFYRAAWMEEAKASGISPEIEERVALRMAKAGMGAYTIRVTLERESPLHEDMKAGKAKEIAEAAKAKIADAREAEREEDHRR